MRRKDREITDFLNILKIIAACDVCTLSLQGDEYPYGVMMSFGEKAENEELYLYFHCAGKGKKLDCIHKNPKAAFTMYCNNHFQEGKTACQTSTSFESVSGTGEISFVEESDKKQAFDIILSHYMQAEQFTYDKKMVAATTLFCMHVREVTGKQHL